MTYLDLDISILDLNPSLFSTKFVAGAIWNKQGAGLEITNAFFCLDKVILRNIIDFFRVRVTSGPDK